MVDAGEPRNAPAAHVHNFLPHDGTPPSEIYAVGREELTKYGGWYQTEADPSGATSVPGVWVAGNLANIQAQVITSAAGLTAGAAINADLAAEDAKRAARAAPRTPAITASH